MIKTSTLKNIKWFYLVIPIVIILVALFAYFKFFKGKAWTGQKEEALEIKVQPQGELQRMPTDMVFYFSESYPGVEGITVEPESLKNFITIDPYLPAQGKWVSERTFEIYFLATPLPDKTYKVKIRRVPLISGAAEIPAQTFAFKTPDFEIVSISLKAIEKNSAVVSLDFTFAPVFDELRQFIAIFDSKNQPVKMWNVTTEKEKPEEVLITVPVIKAPEQYKVIVKKGLKSGLGVVLKKDVETVLPIGFATKPISVKDSKIEESEDGYMLIFQLISPAEKDFDIKEDNLSKLIRISPEIPFRVATSGKGIYIFGDFIPEKNYSVTLKTGITSKKGSILQEDYTMGFNIPKRKEKLQFIYQGRYFGTTGEWNLPLKLSRINWVEITITYLPPDNVLFWHLKDYGQKMSLYMLGEDIIQGRKIEIEKTGKDQVLWINLRDFLREKANGVYLVKAYGETEDKKHLNDRIAIVISDISLVTKWYKNSIYVWAFNSASLNAVTGVEIEARSSKNFLAGKGTTDVNGFCAMSILKEGRDPYVVFAKKGDEWTYVHVPTLRLPMEAYDIAGEEPSKPYLAYMYPERDLYRPGEDVRFNVVVREKNYFKGIALPVRIVIRDPQGRKYLTLSGTTDDYGLHDFSFPTTPSSPTGKYMLELVGGDQTLYTAHIFVEAFVPERMRVKLSLPDQLNIDKPFALKLEAEYLFGAPASGEVYSAKVRAEETPFRGAGYYNYGFGVVRFRNERPVAWESDNLTGTLDQNGKVEKTIRIDTNMVFNDPVRLSTSATVTEGGSGRVTSKSLEKIVYTRPFYIGIKPSGTRVIGGVPLTINGVLLKPDCSLYTGKSRLAYRVYKLSHYYSYGYDDYYNDDYYWNARVNKIPIMSKHAVNATDGKFSFSYTPQTAYNDYLVEVLDEINGTISQVKIYGWGWWYEGEEANIESPEIILIRSDKQEYDAGEEVKVEALLPFEGNILWTVELDTLYNYAWKEAKGEVAAWSFRAPDGVSTCYVSALLVRSGGNYLVQRGLGIQRMRIRPRALKLGFTIDVPQRIKPGDELVINVKGTDRFKGTIAVVDEGILQITDFKTPDPYEGIFRDIGLGINSAESFGWIVKKFLTKTGGGFAAREKEFPEARFTRIVSFWSGIMESGADGSLSYKLKIPQYNGKLRVMVAGANENKLGGQATEVIVKSDVIISPTIPRFMYTSDKFSFPITLLNTTKQAKSVKLSIDMKKGTLKGQTGLGNIQLKPEEKKILWFDCVASEEPGSIDLAINGSSGNEKYHENFVIPLYPNVPFITESEYITVKPNERLDLKPYFDAWYPRAHTVKLLISNIPALSKLHHTKYAIHYPYGCIEQTSTSTLVLLRLSPLLAVIAPDISKEKYTEMVNHGVGRIISMQTISGGFGFWPGDDEPEPWASAYGTFVLLEAKNAGFVVPENVLNAALNYLDALADKSEFVYYILAKGGILQKKPESVDRLIALAKKEKYDLTSLLWVAGVLYESGKTEEAKNILALALNKEPPKVRRYRDDYYSRLQFKGMKLYMVEQVSPGIEEENRLALDISKELGARQSYYYTTQELAWSLLSLGMYAERFSKADYQVDLKIGGKVVKPQKEKGLLSWVLKNPGKETSLILQTSSPNALYLNIENTGFSKLKRAFEPYANGIVLKRNIFSYDGQPIAACNQGDLVVLKMAIKGNNYYDNVAVEASLPAGLEIENPRLGRDDLPTWVMKKSELWQPDYVDMKDDRAVIFGSLSYDTTFYYILARAVTPGTFFLPPSQGVVMYNPELNAHTHAETFEVNKR